MQGWRPAVMAAVLTISGVAQGSADRGPAPETWREPVAAQYGHTGPVGATVRMSDGVELGGDVLYPADPATGERARGRFPVLLVQNPYHCETTASNLALATESAAGSTYYADHGYVFAVVCVRGTGRSGGAFDLWGPRQQQDGVELTRWAAHGLSGG